MTAGNQTRLGFAQQKPRSTRSVVSKLSKKSDSSAEVSAGPENEQARSTEELLERVGTLSKTMEEKLAAYRKAKEEKARQGKEDGKISKKPAPIFERTRSLRSSKNGTQDAKKDAGKQKTLHIAETSKNMSMKTSTSTSTRMSTSASTTRTTTAVTITSTKTTKVIEEAIELRQDDGKDNEPEKAMTNDVAQEGDKMDKVDIMDDLAVPEGPSDVNAQESKDDDSTTPLSELEQAASSKATGEAVAKNTVHKADPSQDHEDDEDNIHPLARTVVKAAPWPSLRKLDSTEDSDTNIPTASSLKPIRTAVKIPHQPIHQATITDRPTLPLPSHLSALYENFKALEHLLVFSKRQGLLSFYHKLKRHVELQSSRNFEIKHLAQFRTILPEGFKFTAAPCLFEGRRTRSILIEMLEIEDKAEGDFVPQADKRHKLFLDRLYDHIKQHHQKFLTSTMPPRTDTYPHHWHPDFDLESVEAIEESEVPLLTPMVIDAAKVDFKDLGRRKDSIQDQSVTKEVPSSSSLNDREQDEAVSTAEPVKAGPRAKPETEPGPVKTLSALEQLKER
ncbi:hypothetical protein BGZ51_009589, partial [Haplosporangium sp. Z 767]